MKRFFIENARSDVMKDGFAYSPVPGNVVATIQFKNRKETQWLNLVDVDGIPNLFLTDEDVYETLVADDYEDEEFSDYMDDHYIDKFEGIAFYGDYYNAFESIAEDPNNPANPLIRYLITLVRCDMDDVDDIIQMGTGRYADEIDIPVSDVEEVYMLENGDEEDIEIDLPDGEDIKADLPDFLEKESYYRMRLVLETDCNRKTVFHYMDTEAFAMEKANLKAVKNRCEDEENYQAWRNNYIVTEYEMVKGKKFLTCSYMFAGIGKCEEIIPAEEKSSFINWINANGSAFFCGEREATEEEIKTYIALKANRQDMPPELSKEEN